MNKLTISKYIICLLLAAALAAGAGCGGDKKKNGAQGSPDGVVAGRVDLFSGFGAELDGAGRASLIGASATVKLYRLQPDGAALAPLPDVQPAQLIDGSFRFDKVPLGERNLIVRVETGEAKPLLAALLPKIAAGMNSVVVSPETDVETALFQKIIRSGVRGAKDVKPWELDASFVKQLVTDSLFFDLPAPQDSEAAAETILPVARAAYGRFIDTLAGKPNTKPNDKKAQKAIDAAAGSLMSLEVAYDAGENVAAQAATLDSSIERAMRDAEITLDRMSGAAVWTTARRQSLLWAAKCLSGPGVDGCPKPGKDAPDAAEYGKLLAASLRERWESEDMIARKTALAVVVKAGEGPAEVPPAVAAKRLSGGVSEKTLAAFGAALAKIESAPGAARAELEKRWLADLRDTLLADVAGLQPAAAASLGESVFQASRKLAASLSGPPDITAVAAAQRDFTASCDAAFTPLSAVLGARYPKLEKTDLGKLDWALRTIIINATLLDVPPAYYASADADGDGAPDNEEQVVGTDPASSKSIPAPVLVSTPASMLPEPGGDADDDGFSDAVEKIAGIDPKDAKSAPQPGRMAICLKGSPVCLARMPESAFAEGALEGSVRYQGEAAAGVYAGVYERASFLGREPLAVALAPTGADGAFRIEKVRAGRYFVAGFTDVGGNGKPEAGAAGGYIGGVYPHRITVSAGANRIDAPLEVLGAIRPSICRPDEYYSPAGGVQCVSECPASMTADRLTRACRCEKGYYSQVSAECVAKCPATFIVNGAGVCVCPGGMQIEKAAAGETPVCKDISNREPPEKPVVEKPEIDKPMSMDEKMKEPERPERPMQGLPSTDAARPNGTLDRLPLPPPARPGPIPAVPAPRSDGK